jgi:acetyltransferase-like isoleucine patch superfamily enzyme
MSDAIIINHKGRGFNFIGEVSGDIKSPSSSRLNDAVIDITGGVEIGKRVHFGHQVMILTTSHPPEITNGEERMKTVNLGKISIEDDVYVGSRVVILKGVTIGKGSYIAAGSVVLEDTKIGERELWAGTPATWRKDL